jgi:tRNA wybutosine-synthesizing protein 4
MTTPRQPTTATTMSMMTTNFDIMKTADDAVRVKSAAVASGYYDDPYVHEFVAIRPTRPSHHRPVHVIIKRGTFARVQCVERVIRSFLHQALLEAAAVATTMEPDEEEEDEGDTDASSVPAEPPQIILLGAGKDTALFRLRDHEIYGSETVRWFEVDQVEMIRQKVNVLTNRPDVFHSQGLSRLNVVDPHATTAHNVDGQDNSTKEIYVLPPASSLTTTGADWTAHFIAHDFIQDRAPDLIAALLQQCGMKPHAPTLIITECVQMYLPVTAVDDLMRSFLANDALTNVSICSYEPILQSDAFGNVMETNLRNSHLLTDDAACVLLQRRTIADLMTALQAAGATLGVASDMKTAYETVLTKSQQDRARRCEFLDELEEWHLIMQHYCLIVATNNQNSTIGTALCGQRSTVGFPDNDPQNVYRFCTS